MLFEISNYLQWCGSLIIATMSYWTYQRGSRSNITVFLGAYGTGSVLFQLVQSNTQTLYRNTVGDVFVLFETLTLLFVFYQAFRRTDFKIVAVLSAGAYLILFLILLSLPNFRSTIRTVRDLLMIVHALIYFFWLIRHLPEENLLGTTMFWVSAAILFFFSSTFILSLTMSYIAIILRDDFRLYWSFRNFLRFLFCVIICYGLWRSRTLKSLDNVV
jgi:hypothetical protein